MSDSAWLHDFRLTLRSVARAKAFYATAVLTLAVGMAGAMVMFTLIRGILLRPLPVPDEDRLVVSWRVAPAGPAIHVPYRSEVWRYRIDQSVGDDRRHRRHDALSGASGTAANALHSKRTVRGVRRSIGHSHYRVHAFIAGLVRDAVRAADPDARVTRVASFADHIRGPLAWPRFNALLFGGFAASALLLSAIGLYGVMAASVRLRLPEIGVRLALGATASDVRRLVLGEGLRLVLAGAVAGLVLAIGSTRVLRSLLFETEPLEPATLLVAVVVHIVAALLATYLPARRAAKVDPLTVLRAE